MQGFGVTEVDSRRVEGCTIHPVRGMLLIEIEMPADRSAGGILMPNRKEDNEMFCTAKVLEVAEARIYRTVDDEAPTPVIPLDYRGRIMHTWVCPSLKFEQVDEDTGEKRKLALIDHDDVRGLIDGELIVPEDDDEEEPVKSELIAVP